MYQGYTKKFCISTYFSINNDDIEKLYDGKEKFHENLTKYNTY